MPVDSPSLRVYTGDVTFLLPELDHSLQHGKRSTYVYHRCRCDYCKEANAEYKRNKVADNAAITASQTARLSQAGYGEAIPWLTHGLPATYEWRGCRCKDCTEAVRRAKQGRRLLRAS